MTNYNNEKGFTLVELAIVMTIIGLLIGGILKGQELMENARVTATIAQVRSYEAATTTFRDTYSAIPGDMANSQNRIPNCNVLCNATGAGAQGDSIMGTGLVLGSDESAPIEEATLFWAHLSLADLIAGVSTTAISGGPIIAWGESHPAAKIGGGFHVGTGNGVANVVGTASSIQPSGLVLVLRNNVIGALTEVAGLQALSASRAGQIDRKMDDGQPNSGFVQAYGVNAALGANGCFVATAAAVPGVYLEASTTKDCGLMFRIQG